MLRLNEFKNASNVAGVISKLFEARDFAHRAHLIAKAKSFAQHEALRVYETLGDLADELYEVYSGQYGTVDFGIEKAADSDVVGYFEDLGKFCLAAHDAFDKKDTHLHNILDEICGEVFRTVYKLKYLK